MLDPIVDNPFWVLELTPEATPIEVERQGNRILGMLELDVSSARSHPSPRGPQPRDADKVRSALAVLRDPQQRVVFEAWARLPMRDAAPSDDTGPQAPWTDALSALGLAVTPAKAATSEKAPKE